MLRVKCINKFRDRNGNIQGYRLVNSAGETMDIKADELKKAIANNKVEVMNLTLTSDNRLVDSDNKVINTATGNEECNMASAIARQVFRGLMGNDIQIQRIKCLSNSTDYAIDERFESNSRKMWYNDREVILAVTHYFEDGQLWLTLENKDDCISICEVQSESLSKEAISNCIKNFISAVRLIKNFKIK